MKKVYPRFALLVLTVIYIINFIDRQIVAVIAPLLKTEFLLSNTEIGLIYGSIFSLFYAFSGIPLGRLSDSITRKKVLLICLFVWSLATILGGFVSHVFQLIVLRVVLAVAQSGASPAAYSLITDLFPKDEVSRRISWYASGIFLGIGSSFLVGGILVESVAWRDAFYYAGFPGFIVLIVALLFVPDVAHQKNQFQKETEMHFWVALNVLFSNTVIRFHLIGFALLALSGYALLSFFSTVMVQMGRPDLIKQYGWFMFGVAGMVLISGYVADFLAKKGNHRRFIPAIVAALGGLPLYWYGLSAESGIGAFLGIGCGALIASSYNGVAASIIQELAPKSVRGLAGGVYLFVISIGGFGVGPFLTGFIADTFFTGDFALQLALKTVLLSCGLAGGFILIKAMLHQKKQNNLS